MKIPIKHIAVFLLISIASLFLHRKEINDFPQHIHAWAQSDYYALSLGFENNGLDFFHPQTYTYNPQFPDYFQTPKDNGITSADFPIHTYNVALLYKLTDTNSPWVFRTYTLFYSIVGLFALFLLVKELGGSDLKAVFAVGFVLLSPVYLYYRDGFLPSIPSYSNVIIAYYFYFKHLKKKKYRYFSLSLFFFLLATLARTPFAIFLIGVLVQEVLSFMLNKKIEYKKIIHFVITFAIIIGYFVYNTILRETYGSIFLGKPLPPDSIEQAKEIFVTAIEKWKWHYLTKWHYLFLTVCFFAVIFQYFKTKKIEKLHQQVLIQTIIISIGVFIYSFLMLKQFVDHDYYFLDTFLTPITIYLAFSLTYLQTQKLYLSILGIAFMGITVQKMHYQSLDAQKQRKEITRWDNTSITINNYTNGDLLLEQLNIPDTAKFLVLDSEVPNIPFILLKRAGYTVHHLTAQNLDNALQWNFDYVVLQDYNAKKILSIKPDLGAYIRKIGGNGAISIFKKTNKTSNKTVEEFLDLPTPFYQTSLIKNLEWRKGLEYNQNTFSFAPSEEFIATLKLNNQLKPTNNLIRVKVKTPMPSGLLILSINNNGENYYAKRKLDTTVVQNFWFATPRIQNINNDITLYIWNNQKDSVQLKNIILEQYKD